MYGYDTHALQGGAQLVNTGVYPVQEDTIHRQSIHVYIFVIHSCGYM